MWIFYESDPFFPLFSCGNELEKNPSWELRNTGLRVEKGVGVGPTGLVIIPRKSGDVGRQVIVHE